jgi:hypothetical protein
MNMHLPHRTHQVRVRPIGHTGEGPHPLLQQVIVERSHPDGDDVIHLSPDQALYVHSRLAVITMAMLHGHAERIEHLGTAHLPDDPASDLRSCGARVWLIVGEGGASAPVVEQVVIASVHPDGDGIIHLSPQHANELYRRLTQIALTHFHETRWGGEDARAQ